MALQKLKIDAEFQALIPPPTAEERRLLERSIQEEGCRDSIVVWGGVILDGHNRYEICQRHKIKFNITEKTFDDRNDAKLWIIFNQRGRRNLTDFQRGELAIAAEAIIAEKAKAKQVESGKNKVPQNSAEPLETREKVASLAGVSHDTIKKIKTVLDHAEPEIVEMARRGDVSPHAAAKIATLPAREQKTAAKAGPKAVVAKARSVSQSESKDQKFADAVPPRIRDVFTEAIIFDELLNHLTQASKVLGRLIGGNGPDAKPLACGITLFPRRQEVIQLGKQLRSLIRSAKPFQLCPYCMGKGPCQKCKGRGWVDEDIWNVGAIEKSMKSKVEGMIKL